MSHARCAGFLASIAALMLPIAPACAFDAAKYPDWKDQWIRRPPTGGVGDAPGPHSREEARITPECGGRHEAGVRNNTVGGHGNNATPPCTPPGMPRAIIVYEPMEIIVRPDITYIHI